eukprot:CAMPEP_0172768688 /NCGR_PEP_ID=MMETSP1074-20121228/185271_1 /TAXON_ID=2916 /ORGANISM="Ceratium fusus, Strain PA161109" /LENGTH=84 /DNA_ID=CAMNT_0013604131 /DNA_START=100 /DNA_END=350 /DNA_ORIENTATION=-
MTEKDSEHELRAKVEAAYSSIAASAKSTVSGSASASTAIGSKTANTKLTVLGGNSLLWLQLTKDNQDEIQHKWAKSVTDHNEYP